MATFLHRALPSIVLAGLAGAVPARAAEPGQDYAALRAGVYLSQTGPAPNASSYRTGVALELAAGRAFLPFLSGEIGVGFARAESGEHMGSYPGAIAYLPMTTRFWLLPVSVTAKGVLPGGSIEPYVFGGVGLYLIWLEKDPTNGLPPVSDNASAVGFHAGLGATWRAAERVTVGIDGRYVWVSHQFLWGRYAFDGLGLTASLGWRF